MLIFASKHFQLEILSQFLFGIHIPGTEDSPIIGIHFGPFCFTVWDEWK